MPRRPAELGHPLIFAETCGVCDNQVFWWRSRSGYQICMACSPDPWAALEVLARRGKPGLIQHVQAWTRASSYLIDLGNHTFSWCAGRPLYNLQHQMINSDKL
jgi:hypothetical protein